MVLIAQNNVGSKWSRLHYQVHDLIAGSWEWYTVVTALPGGNLISPNFGGHAPTVGGRHGQTILLLVYH